MPRVAKLLSIPRRFDAKGVQRSLHGLSYTFLMASSSDWRAPRPPGRLVLAHLGNGASLAAVRDGKSIDTSMAHPAAGIHEHPVRRPDPGLFWYLARTEQMTGWQFTKWSTTIRPARVSEISPTCATCSPGKPRTFARRGRRPVLLPGEEMDRRIYGGLGGLDTLVFAGALVRSLPGPRPICEASNSLASGWTPNETVRRAGHFHPRHRVTVRVIARTRK